MDPFNTTTTCRTSRASFPVEFEHHHVRSYISAFPSIFLHGVSPSSHSSALASRGMEFVDMLLYDMGRDWMPQSIR